MKTLRCILSLFAIAFLLNSWAETILVQDDFTGAAGNSPNPAEFQCGGPVTLNGSGELNLNTLGTGFSWIKTIDSATPGATGTVVLQFRAYAYAEGVSGLYGNRQPRGLRVGTDADNVIEFYSAAGNLIGMRARANGVETSATHAVASVYNWHDYEIIVNPGSAIFKVDGSIVATLTTNLPVGALNAHFATTTHMGNVPIALQSLSFFIQSALPSITSFTPTSGPVGTSVTLTGSNFTGTTAVKFGVVDATAFTVDTASQITATVPTGSVSGPLSIVTPSGTAISGENFTVTEISQTITFDPIPTKEMGTSPFTVTATASSGLPVTYSSSNPAVATVSGSMITIHGIGSSIITANQPGSGSFFPAPTVGRLLKVRGVPSRVASWGYNSYRQCNAPEGLDGVVEIAAGYSHTLALKSDGTVVAWGDNSYGQCNVPPDLTEVVDIASGVTFSLALKTDGTVTAWGFHQDGQCDVPPDLTGVIAIAGGVYHGAALKADGTVVIWGDDRAGLRDVPPGLKDVVAIAAGGVHTLALKHDGTVVAWTYNSSGQCDVPAGLNGVVAIDAGNQFSMALKSDGTVVVWGANQSGWSAILQPPAGLIDVAAVTAGSYSYFASALKRDGTVVSWGDSYSGLCDVPLGLANVTSISGSSSHTVVITPNPTPPPEFTYSRNGSVLSISGYVGSNNDVVIPETISGYTVTTIGSNAFRENATLTSISIPASVTSIETSWDWPNTMPMAFKRCANLSSFHVAEGNSAFRSIDGVLFSADQTTLLCYPPGRVGDYSVPTETSRIGDGAFNYCSRIGKVQLPNTATSLGAYTFMASSLTEINLPHGITEIGRHVFNGCQISSIDIPDSVTIIGFSAFMYCPNLEDVALPNGLLAINSWAFGGCSKLKSIVIPASLASLQGSAFSDCQGLTSVRMLGNAPTLDEWQPESAFQGSPVTIYRMVVATGWPPVPEPWAGRPTALWGDAYQLTVQGGSGAGGYVTGAPVTITAENAPSGQIFDGWAGDVQYLANPSTQTATLTMPAVNVTLTATYRDNDFTYTIQDEKVTITGCGRGPGPVNIPGMIEGLPVTEIGYQAFYRWSGLTRVSIPDTVTRIGAYAFYGCNQLPEIRIPDSVTEIGEWSFSGLTVGSVSISRYLTHIGPQAFTSCQQMTVIAVDENNPNYSSVNGVLFDKNPTTLIQFPGGKGGVYTIPGQVNRIENRAFQYSPLITGVIIPNSVTVIGEAAFYYCPQLTSVSIPRSVTSIEYAAFQYCQKLVSAVFDGNAPAMESGVFDITHERFNIYCYNGASGFTPPLWKSYPCVVLLKSGLLSLELSTGGLNPSFNSMRTAYVAGVSGDTNSLTVTPIAADASSTITVNGIPVTSGAASGVITIFPGINTLTVVVTDPDSSSRQYIVVVSTTTFASWRESKFSSDELSDPAVSGDQANPAHDGISNLMKYALALEPMVCGTADLPYSDKDGVHLTLTYRQNKQAADINFTVEVGESLTGESWLPATSELSRTDEGDYWLVTVQDIAPIANSSHRFMRLKVSR